MDLGIGQEVTELIHISNSLQKLSADSRDLDGIYMLAVEAKTVAEQIKRWATIQMERKRLENQMEIPSD